MTALSEELLLERRRSVRLRRSAMLKASSKRSTAPTSRSPRRTTSWPSPSPWSTGILSLRVHHQSSPDGDGLQRLQLSAATCVFIFRTYLTVISTLTQIFDSELFGLPMDVLYKGELDTLRGQGRNITELSALAPPGGSLVQPHGLPVTHHVRVFAHERCR